MAKKSGRAPPFIQNNDVCFFEFKKFGPPEGPELPLVYVWDIEKTYLHTRFESLRGLIRVAFEKAFQKVNVPGTVSLIRSLGEAQSYRCFYFVSASPPQMQQTIYGKMQLDNIDPHGIFFKDNLKNLRFRKFKRLKQQVGFKVQAMLELLVHVKKQVRLVLFGDDSESDAVVYNLVSDICQRRLKETEYLTVLEALHVLPEQRKRIIELQKQIPEYDPVYKIFINLINDTDPDYYAKFGRRTLATFTSFQAALDLFVSGLIDLGGLELIARDMIANYGFTPEILAKNFEDLRKRDFMPSDAESKILPSLKEKFLLPQRFNPPFRPTQALQKIGEKILGLEFKDPWIPEHIDYLNDFR